MVRLYPSQLKSMSGERIQATGADAVADLAARHPFACARNSTATNLLREENPTAYDRLICALEKQTRTANDLDRVDRIVLHDLDLDVLEQAVLAADPYNSEPAYDAVIVLAQRAPQRVPEEWCGIRSVRELVQGLVS